MDYEKHYHALISRAKGRLLECYTEKHHIIPRCLGGADDADNIVELTAEEHYVAHQLLVKMHPSNHKIVYAAHLMTIDSNGERANNKSYGWIRRRMSEQRSGVPLTEEHKAAISASLKGKPAHNKGSKHTEEAKKKMSRANRGKKKSPEHAAKLRKVLANTSGMTGRKHSAETKRKMALAAKKREELKRQQCLDT